jgi:tRNA A-37 threonylcarbamoyl transferase component Bud32/tetratricopeptide (TPR) repeat protein
MATPQHRFGPGDLVADRYEVVRFLAQGGMADVYEARDRTLGVPLALKVIRPHLAWDERTLRALRREVRLARRVTHRGVCRLFDIGFHQGRGGAQPFLTMELVPGETLAARLRRVGRLSPAQALPIVRQVVDALDAAHAAGIAHRDFKPGNVILAGDRVVVTDFGLARHAESQGDTTRSGLRAGTPAYMAPEQVEGRSPTTATDIYALGVVLHELVTGSKPFPPGAPLEQRLQADPPSPRLLRADLDPAWERVILRCLSRDPHERFGRVAEVAQALDPAVPRGRRRALGLLAVAALALLALPVSRPAERRRAVALLPLRSLSGEPAPAWEQVALAELLPLTLPEGSGLRMAGPGDPADLVLSGSRGEAGGRERLDLRLLDGSGAAVGAWAVEAALGDAASLAAGIAQRLAGRPAAAAVELPPAAARRWAQGLLALRAGLPASAADELSAAAELAPHHPLVHLGLAEACARLGLHTRTAAAARRATEQAVGLSSEPRLLVEARAHELAGLWPRALAAYRELARDHPDDPAHARRLAEALAAAQAGSGPPRTLSR